METNLNYGISKIRFVLLKDAIRKQTLFTLVTRTSLQGKNHVQNSHGVLGCTLPASLAIDWFLNVLLSQVSAGIHATFRDTRGKRNGCKDGRGGHGWERKRQKTGLREMVVWGQIISPFTWTIFIVLHSDTSLHSVFPVRPKLRVKGNCRLEKELLPPPKIKTILEKKEMWGQEQGRWIVCHSLRHTWRDGLGKLNFFKNSNSLVDSDNCEQVHETGVHKY